MSPWTPQIYLFWEVNRNSIEKRQKGAHQSTHGIYNSHQKAQKGKGKQKTTPPPQTGPNHELNKTYQVTPTYKITIDWSTVLQCDLLCLFKIKGKFPEGIQFSW